MTDVLGIGMMNPDGGIIIPCNYQRIDLLAENWQLLHANYYSTRKIKLQPFFFVTTNGDLEQVFNHECKPQSKKDSTKQLDMMKHARSYYMRFRIMKSLQLTSTL